MQRRGYYSLYLRGYGFKDEQDWHNTLAKEINCPLNRFTTQGIYAEVYFEAHAMQGQFLHYANENLPLLAFGGDVSISAKWKTAERLANRYKELGKPIHIYYFGDYDEKGLTIPQSAWRDIGTWAGSLIINQGVDPDRLSDILHFHRIGINENQIDEMNLPENPERPGTYQWEALGDEQAEELIAKANDLLYQDAFDEIVQQEEEITDRLRDKLKEAGEDEL